MKHILGIMGSPRVNGNTHALVSRILDGAREAGAATEMLLLPELRIEDCDGCFGCWKGKPCHKRDDMNGVYPRIIASDVLVFGTPVYWYGPTALLKAFVDRLVYFTCPENREKIRGKTAAIAIPFEDEDAASAELTVAFFEKSLKYVEVALAGKVIVPGVFEKGAVLKKESALEEAYQLGKRLAGGTG